MRGCIQPMSSPMMKRMLGFLLCCCAATGVMAGPDNDINIVAPKQRGAGPLVPASRLAWRGWHSERLVLWYAIKHGVTLPFMMRQKLLA